MLNLKPYGLIFYFTFLTTIGCSYNLEQYVVQDFYTGFTERLNEIQEHSDRKDEETAALSRAAKSSRNRFLQLLLSKGVTAEGGCENQCTSPLALAVLYNNVQGVRMLLEYGANPNKVISNYNYSAENITPLMLASGLGSIEIAALLLDYGANPNSITSGKGSSGEIGDRDALFFAVNGITDWWFLFKRKKEDRATLELVELLIWHGADPYREYSKIYNTVLGKNPGTLLDMSIMQKQKVLSRYLEKIELRHLAKERSANIGKAFQFGLTKLRKMSMYVEPEKPKQNNQCVEKLSRKSANKFMFRCTRNSKTGGLEYHNDKWILEQSFLEAFATTIASLGLVDARKKFATPQKAVAQYCDCK